MADKPQEMGVGVEGIVSHRTKLPYILLFHGEKRIAQLTMADARNFAHDILTMCSRIEADAMIFKFFNKNDFPEAAVAALMHEFRIFRLELDAEPVGKTEGIPSGDIFDFTKYNKPQ